MSFSHFDGEGWKIFWEQFENGMGYIYSVVYQKKLPKLREIMEELKMEERISVLHIPNSNKAAFCASPRVC